VANVRSGNSAYVDTTGSITTDKNTKVVRILFTPDAANDELLLKDGTAGSSKIYLRLATAKKTEVFDLGDGINFPNEIYVSTLTAGAKAVLMLKSGGVG
jgi:hypothetical protein